MLRLKPKKDKHLHVKVTALQEEFIDAMTIRHGIGKAEFVRMSLNLAIKGVDENGVNDLLLNHRRDLTYEELQTPIKKILAKHHQQNADNVFEFPRNQHYASVFGCGVYADMFIKWISGLCKLVSTKFNG